MARIASAWARDAQIIAGGKLSRLQIAEIKLAGGGQFQQNMPKTVRIFDGPNGQSMRLAVTNEDGDLMDEQDILTASYEQVLEMLSQPIVRETVQPCDYRPNQKNANRFNGYTFLVNVRAVDHETGEVLFDLGVHRLFLDTARVGLYVLSQSLPQDEEPQGKLEDDMTYLRRHEAYRKRLVYPEQFALLQASGPLTKSHFDWLAARCAFELFTPGGRDRDKLESLARHAQVFTTWQERGRDRQYRVVENVEEVQSAIAAGLVALPSKVYALSLFEEVTAFIALREAKRAARQVSEPVDESVAEAIAF